MVLGIGVDIVEIKRIANLFNSRGYARFIERILNEKERVLFYQVSGVKKNAWLAKRFAAKEAVLKALGCGLAQGLTFHDISISNDAMGKPQVSLYNKAFEKLTLLGGKSILLSLSDERDYAVAFANIV